MADADEAGGGGAAADWGGVGEGDGWQWEDPAAADDEDEWGGGKEPKADPDADAAVSRPGPEASVLLVDCTLGMFEKEASGKSLFRKSVNLIHKSLLDQMTRRTSDLVSIIFFGTKVAKNVNDYDNVYVLSELEVPCTEMVTELERTVLMPDRFEEAIGGGQAPQLHDALWLCKHMFTRHTGKLSSRQVLVLTTTDAPYADDARGQKLREVVLQRAKDAKEEGVEINVLPLCRAGQGFDVGAFYEHVITAPAPTPLVLGDDDAKKSDEADAVCLEQFKSKVLRRRPTMVVPFSLADGGPRLGVRVYALRRSATKSATVNILAKDQIPLGTKVRYTCATSGKMIRPEEIRKSVRYGGDHVVFTQDEVRRMKRIEDDEGGSAASSREVGLTLIGFKPRSRLKLHFNVKPAQLVYPDETVIRGSTACFRALRDACVRKGKVALCRLIGSRAAEPRFVMLDPTEPGDGAPTGFHLIYLPYKDDMRKPQVKMEPCKEQPTQEQVEAVESVIDKLTSKDFDARRIHNPALARYNKMLETLAFDRDAYEPPEDETVVPEEEIVARAGAEIDACVAKLFPDGYDAKAAPSKRKAKTDGGGKAAKRPKAESEFTPEQMREKVADGTVGKLTVPLLKEFAASVDIKTTGMKKADLVYAIVEWSQSGAAAAAAP